MTKEDVMYVVKNDLTIAKVDIKSTAKYLIRNLEEVVENIDNNPDCINSCGVLQGNGVAFDMLIAKLSVLLKVERNMKD